jgi:type IV pilus assembly protein PilE
MQGFTLIELLVVVAVAAILAVIAYGSYSEHIVRTHRIAAQNAMLEIANRQQQHFTSNRLYADTLTSLGYSLPPEVAARYTLTLAADNTATPPTFLITLAPIAGSSQAGDGNLTLDQAGVKTPASKWK